MRGEYFAASPAAIIFWELPPRARRIHVSIWTLAKFDGTTSACAENTHRKNHRRQGSWNYLRVRGEYRFLAGAAVPPWELPPRARRIPPYFPAPAGSAGTTSACAENTVSFIAIVLSDWNYLRVRGEYSTRSTPTPARPELPPRARRIP